MAQWMQCNWIQQDPIWADSSCSVPTGYTPGGSGYPVDWQGKRRKLTLKEQPEKHLRSILDSVVAEYYGEIVASALPKSVKAEAAALVKPFVEGKPQAIPKPAAVDWLALQQDAFAVAGLIRLWNEEMNARAIEDEDEELLLMVN